jgi:hypothetical protein
MEILHKTHMFSFDGMILTESCEIGTDQLVLHDYRCRDLKVAYQYDFRLKATLPQVSLLSVETGVAPRLSHLRSYLPPELSIVVCAYFLDCQTKQK